MGAPVDGARTNALEFIRTFVPPYRPKFDWKEMGEGQLHIPHQMLEFAVKATSSRNELILLLFFIRYTLGFRRGQFQVGYSFLSEWTGVSDVTNLRKGLKTLLASGLVRKVGEHNSVSNTGATYEVPMVCRFLGLEGGDPSPSGNGGGGGRRPKRNLLKASSAEASEIAQGANEPPASGLEDLGPVGNLPTKKEKKKYNLKKSLSSELPEDLRRQIEQTRPLNKRYREVRCLRVLLTDYTPEQVSKALGFVKEEGVLHTGETCHSPFSYLSVAIADVLQKDKNVQPSASVNRSPNPVIPFPTVVERKEDEFIAWEQALSTFETELANDQKDRCIQSWIENEASPKFLPSQAIIRRVVAMRWYSMTRISGSSSSERIDGAPLS